LANHALQPQLLLVDDDPLIAETLGFLLGDGFDIVAAASRAEAIARVRGLPRPPALALVDLGLPPLAHRPDEGFALIPELLAHAPEIRIVVLSGQNDEANARHARALGATEFVAKPADPPALRALLCDLLTLPAPAGPEYALLGRSLAMQKLRAQIGQFAESPFPVLIEGESGSGKEVVASGCLHRLTSRRERPFLALNCAAIAPTLLEPTLFGHARGAYTGALQAQSGCFEDAGEGTLFLDEIGELPLELQPKLLRVLENGEYQRVGETQLRRSRARIVAATNRDLRREVRAGRFRADLYHRLSVFTLNVPPLRDMGDDHRLLLDHFRALYARESGQPPFSLSADADALLGRYTFPGNVRELRNIVIRLIAKHAGRQVDAADLAAELDLEDADQTALTAPPRSVDALVEMAGRHLQADAFNLDETLRLWEQSYIHAALRLADGNMSRAARLLGINRTTLYARMSSAATRLAREQGQ